MNKLFHPFVFCLLMLMACGKKSSGNDRPNFIDTAATARVDSSGFGFEVDTFHVVKSESGCEKNECTTVDIYYEKIKTTGKPVYDSINGYIDDFMKMALMNLGYVKGEINLEQLATDFITSSNDPELDLGGSWYWEHSTHIFQPVNEVISVSSGFGGYTGGAHGNFTTVTTNFFVTSGKEVKLTDIFTDMNAVNKMAVTYFKRDNQLDESIDLLEHGWDVSDEDFALNENFDITTESITWQFNQYEIGPYAAGAPTVTIPIKDLKQFMKISFTDVVIN